MTADSDVPLTSTELIAAVRAMSRAQFTRLTLVARTLVAGLSMEPQELVAEALMAVLDGRRRTCPVGLPIDNFLIGVMKSLAYSTRKYERNRAVYEVFADEGEGEAILAHEPDLPASPETLVELSDTAARWLARIRERFAGDAEVLTLINGRLTGLDAAAIRMKLDKSDVEFASICRRLRRGYLEMKTENEND